MIEADTRELETKLRQTVIHIRQKEVDLFTDQFAVLASSATFMSSLGFGALNMEIGFLEKDEGEYCSELVGCDGHQSKILTPMALFYVFAATGTAFNLLTVILASFCMIFGPELAIRGSEVSMNHAVKGMYEERHHAIQFFWVGCLFIVLSGISLGWMKFPPVTASIMTGIFMCLISFCFLYQRQLAPKFKYKSEEGLEQLRSTLAQGGGHLHHHQHHPSNQQGSGLSPSANTRSASSSQSVNSSRSGGLFGSSHHHNHPPRDHHHHHKEPQGSSSHYGSINPPKGMEHSANIFADGTLRYGVFANNVLRLFSLDGKELASFSSTRRVVAEDHFVLVPAGEKHHKTHEKPREITCFGTTELETQKWLSALNHEGSSKETQ